jgi:hypothetical protein
VRSSTRPQRPSRLHLTLPPSQRDWPHETARLALQVWHLGAMAVLWLKGNCPAHAIGSVYEVPQHLKRSSGRYHVCGLRRAGKVKHADRWHSTYRQTSAAPGVVCDGACCITLADNDGSVCAANNTKRLHRTRVSLAIRTPCIGTAC